MNFSASMDALATNHRSLGFHHASPATLYHVLILTPVNLWATKSILGIYDRRESERQRMRKTDITCPECGAGFRRIELTSQPGTEGQYRCPACDAVLEKFNDRKLVAYCLTVQPSVRSLVN